MKVLVVGGGGREHAMVRAVSRSPLCTKCYCAPGNGGTSAEAENVPIAADDVAELLAFARDRGIDLTIVGPEAPLVKGIVNAFEKEGRPIFGPTAEAAELEGSKAFAKEMMRKHRIPTAPFRSFNSPDEALAYVENLRAFPVVVKADGLAAGKGVYVVATASMAAWLPDLVVHCAILNDWDRMYADRRLAWNSYVEATRVTAEAAASAGAAYVLVSTDWVFDGTQSGADEETPPNPINLYGVLKMASELVALERGGAVARVSGVNGLHRTRPATPRAQDPGFGYFVASIVDALRAGRRYRVWIADDINMIATPSLATESAEMILDIGRRRLRGVFHTCGGESIGRLELAESTCDVFDLDAGLLDTGPPETPVMPGVRIPYDTSITMPRTAAALDRVPTPLRSLLERFRAEYEAAV